MSASRWNTKAAKEALRLIRQGQRHERNSLCFEALKNQSYNAAYACLTDVFGVSLFRFCVNMVGYEAAKDITEQAFLTARKSFSSFRGVYGVKSLGRWLFRIAYHDCLKELEQRKRTVQGEQLLEITPAVLPNIRSPQKQVRRSRTTYYERWKDHDAVQKDIAKLTFHRI